MSEQPQSADDLSAEEMRFIADHLAESADYLSHLSQLWLEEGDDQSFDAAEIDLPELSAEEARLLRTKVFGRLQRGNMTAKTVRLGTEGMMQALLALVRPILGVGNAKD